MTEPRPEREGRSRREYRVTGAGRASLRESAKIAARVRDLDPGVEGGTDACVLPVLTRRGGGGVSAETR